MRSAALELELQKAAKKAEAAAAKGKEMEAHTLALQEAVSSFEDELETKIRRIVVAVEDQYEREIKRYKAEVRRLKRALKQQGGGRTPTRGRERSESSSSVREWAEAGGTESMRVREWAELGGVDWEDPNAVAELALGDRGGRQGSADLALLEAPPPLDGTDRGFDLDDTYEYVRADETSSGAEWTEDPADQQADEPAEGEEHEQEQLPELVEEGVPEHGRPQPRPQGAEGASRQRSMTLDDAARTAEAVQSDGRANGRLEQPGPLEEEDDEEQDEDEEQQQQQEEEEQDGHDESDGDTAGRDEAQLQELELERGQEVEEEESAGGDDDDAAQEERRRWERQQPTPRPKGNGVRFEGPPRPDLGSDPAQERAIEEERQRIERCASPAGRCSRTC